MILYYMIAIVILILDQWTKWLVVTKMDIGQSIPIIENFFYLTSHRNQGAAWGILQGQMWFFYIITVVVIGFVIYYLHQYGKESKVVGFALALILAGAAGNFIDRVFRKEVVDFANTYIFSYNFPIFNVADSSLVIGVIFVMIATFVDERNKKGSMES
ncbi:signal peptidase II Aspartic peptidase. MEROPS family A08 [Halobacillus karajensis]|uniref:Lipoprotein signal peptidase n=1 Tax=Halobacillus karajensis TaxID=195088 RepID=A0A024P2J6_9BACI|nr:signal peptidase II [Halobacillus karajensis]CDQ19823.1 Lipoprotein signal peptidase [Halobacillus karajensis]CDQ22283.1 Lipoprotein signal peptidase [Halobacillus karajensis]CDQ28124.1 Lipoprotein signal peptidase [Halobacillus karajensis]SEH71569.1 signal peptidase II Aspartic peptidase. MEROPS family A08 [Halobacillus karajensis]